MALSNASIRAIPRTTGRTIYRCQSESDGAFHLDGIEPGTYTLAVSLQGFREKLIDNLLVTTGREVDLGRVRLDIASCDAPGVICDSFLNEPVADTTFSRGEIKIPLGCAVDIDKAECYAPPYWTALLRLRQ